MSSEMSTIELPAADRIPIKRANEIISVDAENG